MSNNTNLCKAKKQKKDEFYTQLADIEKELMHYKRHFENKTVFCNCNDGPNSNFFRFFDSNFKSLKLKCLIATDYKKDQTQKAFLYEINNNTKTKRLLNENGDFRGQECIELLKKADVIVTNPPFSLFREYVAQLVEYDKKFLIIGNINAVTYKDIFPLVKENKVWLGTGSANGNMEFQVPDSYPLIGASCRTDENGQKYIKMCNIRWFTNLDVSKRHKDLILHKHYNPKDYPKYDNYDAINVDKTVDIPIDYDGVMGVPITFLDKYNPNHFEILGLTSGTRYIGNLPCLAILSGKKLYNRILIKRKSM